MGIVGSIPTGNYVCMSTYKNMPRFEELSASRNSDGSVVAPRSPTHLEELVAKKVTLMVNSGT